MHFALTIKSLGNLMTALTEWVSVAILDLESNKKSSLFCCFKTVRPAKKLQEFLAENLRRTLPLELQCG
jgi:hypothetical protein